MSQRGKKHLSKSLLLFCRAVLFKLSACTSVFLLSNWTGRRQASLQFSQLLPCKLRQAPQASVSFRAALSCMGIKSAWFPGVDTCSQLRGCVCLARSRSSMRYFADAVDVTPPTWPHDQSRRTATFALLWLYAAHRDARRWQRGGGRPPGAVALQRMKSMRSVVSFSFFSLPDLVLLYLKALSRWALQVWYFF